MGTLFQADWTVVSCECFILFSWTNERNMKFRFFFIFISSVALNAANPWAGLQCCCCVFCVFAHICHTWAEQDAVQSITNSGTNSKCTQTHIDACEPEKKRILVANANTRRRRRRGEMRRVRERIERNISDNNGAMVCNLEQLLKLIRLVFQLCISAAVMVLSYEKSK